MNNMAKQMEMFDEGGLMDEGGTVDPVSGNDVPPGSTQEEVRDDIPAQLSEGEFVFPADVVRFIGLEKLMKIRQRAKAGLQRMEDMGQMGNSEEAIMPDTLPFSIEDLDMEDEDEYNTPQEFNQGGMPDSDAGVYYNPALQPTTGVAPAPVTAASSNIARSIPIAQAATPMQAGSSNQPAMFNNYPLPQAPVPTMPQRDDLPPFMGGVVPGVGSGIDFDEEIYVNDAGQTIIFRRYKDGSLKDTQGNVAVIPEGYKIKSEAEKDVGTGPVKVESATVQEEGGDDRDDVTSGTTMSFGGEIGPKGNVINSVRGNMSIRGVNYGTGPLGLGGIKDVSGLMARSLSSGINQMTGGKFGTPMSLNKGESIVLENLIQTRPGINNNVDLGNVGIELDADFYNAHVSGKGVTQRGKVAEVANFIAERYSSGTPATPTYDKSGNLISPGNRLGKGSILSASQTLDQIDLEKSREERKSKVEAAQNSSGAERELAFGVQDKSSPTGYTQGSLISDAIVEAQADMARDAARDSGDTSGFGEGGREASDFGGQQNEGSASDPSPDGGMANEGDVGYGSGTDCLTEDMKVKLNGVVDFVTNVKVGDIIDSYRVKEVLHKHMRNGYYAINNELKISNDHPVLANGTWTRPEDLVVGDSINGIPVSSLEYVEQLTPTVSIVIDGESFDVHTENNIYTVHGRYREIRQEAA